MKGIKKKKTFSTRNHESIGLKRVTRTQNFSIISYLREGTTPYSLSKDIIRGYCGKT